MNLRKLGIFLGVSLILTAQQAFAVGLGEIKLNSVLNEPLDAEIQISNVGDLSDVELLVDLASLEDFKQAGVDREFLLTSLDFQIDFTGGKRVIRITSKDPIQEPYLDFLVELQWPSGRLLREYTLLLDLPVFVKGEKAAKKIKAAEAASTSRSTPRDIPISGDDYTVKSGDTLWSVAQRSKPGNYSVNQTLNALYDLNPQAFIDGDMDLLKKGAILRLPEGSDIDRLSNDRREPASIRDVLVESSPKDIPDITEDSAPIDEYSDWTEADAPKPEGGEGRLKLAAVSSEEGGDGVSDSDVLSSDLAANGFSSAESDAVQEELTKTQRENEELKSRLANLEEQIETMQRMVELNAETASAIQSQVDKAPAPATSKPEKEVGLFSWLTYVLIGLIVLLLVLLLIFRGRKKDSFEDDFTFNQELAPEDEKSFSAIDEPEESLEEEILAADEDNYENSIAASLELSPDEEIDPIEQADIYISLGNNQEAEEILKDALESNPGNVNAHLKLLSIYADNGDLPQFDMQRAQLAELDNPEADAEAAILRASIPEPSATEDIETASEKDATEDLDLPEQADQTDDIDNELDEDIDIDQLATDLEMFDQEIEEASEDSFAIDSELETEQESSQQSEFDEPATAETIDLDDLDLDVTEESLSIPEEDTLEIEPEPEEELDTNDEFQGLSEEPASVPEDDINAEEECATKLELAQAYIDMGDTEGAREMLQEVSSEGTDQQKQQAHDLMASI